LVTEIADRVFVVFVFDTSIIIINRVISQKRYKIAVGYFAGPKA